MAVKLDAQEAKYINDLLERFTIDAKNTVIGSVQDMKELDRIGLEFANHKRTGSCKLCWIGLMDAVRKVVGLAPARRPVDAIKAKDRLDMCHECPVYHKSTGSCGRLIIDAIIPEPVIVNGKSINPCGCIVALKVHFGSETCPGNFW